VMLPPGFSFRVTLRYHRQGTFQFYLPICNQAGRRTTLRRAGFMATITTVRIFIQGTYGEAIFRVTATDQFDAAPE